MRIIIFGLLVVAIPSLAAEPTVQDARRLSLAIINRIPDAEKEIKKAVEYGDEDGYDRLQVAPMAWALRAWRDGEEKNPVLFKKYESCLNTGVYFQLYSTAMFGRTLQSDRNKVSRQKSYKEELSKCKEQLR